MSDAAREAPSPAAPAAPAVLAIGAGVSHRKFGAGTIVGRDGERVLLAKFWTPA